MCATKINRGMIKHAMPKILLQQCATINTQKIKMHTKKFWSINNDYSRQQKVLPAYSLTMCATKTIEVMRERAQRAENFARSKIISKKLLLRSSLHTLS